jgi:hypothetical protein
LENLIARIIGSIGAEIADSQRWISQIIVSHGLKL